MALLRLVLVAVAAVAANGYSRPTVKAATGAKPAAVMRKLGGAAALGLLLGVGEPANAGVCSYAPNSDLCVAEKAREAAEAKANPAKGKAGAVTGAVAAAPAPKAPAPKAPAPKAPAPKPLTKEAQAVKDTKDRMAKLTKERDEAVAAVSAAQKALEKLPEERALLAAESKLAAAKGAYDKEMPVMKSKLQGLKEAADKKAKKEAFVEKNKQARLKKEAKAKADKEAAAAKAKAAKK